MNETQTEALADQAIERARVFLPTLRRADGRLRRSIKCVLVPATLDDDDKDNERRPLLVKAVFAKSEIWPWYMRREHALYEAFANDSPPITPLRIPRLLSHARSGEAAREGILIVDRFVDAESLVAKRHDHLGPPTLPEATWTSLIALLRSLRAWSRGEEIAKAVDESTAITNSIQTTLRRRFLEDPTAPLAWMEEGVARALEQGIVDANDATAMSDALRDHHTTCFAHGDLLLRNVLVSTDSEEPSGLIDWECAGSYIEGWDAALLSVWAPLRIRAELATIFASTEKAQRSFVACRAFALIRELVFRGVNKPNASSDAVVTRLKNDLRDAIDVLLHP